MKRIIYFFIINLSLVSISLALEIDSRITAKIIQISDSKRTIMIDQGMEEGLKEGDHARLSLPTGIVGRAVMMKGAPTRSVWSIYDLNSPEQIEKEKILTFKIIYPAKLKNDSPVEELIGSNTETENNKNLADDTDTSLQSPKQRESISKHQKDDMRKTPLTPTALDKELSYVDSRGIDYSALNDGPYKTEPASKIDYSSLNENLNDPYSAAKTDYSNLKDE